MLIILTGKSGSGKDAIQSRMITNHQCQRIVTATTRPKRAGEVDGKDYFFLNNDEFISGIADHRFIEFYEYHTTANGRPATYYYGSFKQELDAGKNYVVILDPQGAKTFVEYYGKEYCFIVSVEVPDAVREERAAARGSFNKAEWDNRLREDNAKFTEKFIDAYVDFRVDNSGDLDQAVHGILNAI